MNEGQKTCRFSGEVTEPILSSQTETSLLCLPSQQASILCVDSTSCSFQNLEYLSCFAGVLCRSLSKGAWTRAQPVLSPDRRVRKQTRRGDRQPPPGVAREVVTGMKGLGVRIQRGPCDVWLAIQSYMRDYQHRDRETEDNSIVGL